MTAQRDEDPATTTPAAQRVDVPASGRYMYAVSRGLTMSDLAAVRGIDDQPLELVTHRDLAALVSSVPMATFGEESLRRNLEDLAWLETMVRAHDAVIQAAATLAPTAPLRFATVCYDDDAVRQRLDDAYASLSAALDRVTGCAEWSVKVLTSAQGAAPSGAAVEPPASGAEYLRRKKAQATRALEADEKAAAAAQLIHQQLAGRARASRRLPAQDPRLSGHQGSMVLNAAYLVQDDDASAFEALLSSVRGEQPDVLIESRGPWPPYSFAMLEEG